MKHDLDRVAFFVPDLRGGGAEWIILTLANKFAEWGIPTDLIIVNKSGKYTDKISNDVRTFDLGKKRTLKGIKPLADYISSEKPDSILSTLVHANISLFYAYLISNHAPKIFARETNSVSKRFKNGSYKNKALLLHASFCYKYFNKVIGISEGLSDELVRSFGLEEERVKTIYNPAVSSEIINGNVSKTINGKSCRYIILGVGSLTEQKDFPTLIKSLELVRESVDAELVILGEGEQRAKLERLTRELNIGSYVKMPGFVEDPHEYMRGADIFVLSSRWEGFGNVLAEAMACGTPVVSTDCEYGPGEILQGGKLGSLVPIQDPHALSEAIIDTLTTTTDVADLVDRAKSFKVDQIAQRYLRTIVYS